MATMLNRALASCVYAVIVTASTLTTAAPCGQANSVPDDNKLIVADAFDRWAAGGTSFFHDLLHDNVVWRIKGSGPSAGEFRGRDVFLDRAVRPFASRLSARSVRQP
ncbi:hypothetical protein [Bradyrhizobium liaoningense]|uniref:hypothetical protein n=1 Tax=Bradyrhizobium liaoningense TaxID=43992 RepID=UPI0004ADD795|nr:hypothetical protein [Bradyrhizobium liaoningense]